MSDRTMIDVAGKTCSFRGCQGALQVLTAMGSSRPPDARHHRRQQHAHRQGRLVIRRLSTWLAFIQRPEVIGTMLLTAVVTVLYLHWDKPSSSGNRR